MILLSNVEKISWGETIPAGLVIGHRTLKNTDKMPRISVRQWLNQYRVDDAEDGDCRPKS